MPYVIVSTVALLSNLYKNAPLIVGDKDSDPELMRFLGARITTNYPACGSPAMYVMHAPPRSVFDNLEKRGYCLMCAQTIQEHSVWILARPRVPDDDKVEISRGGPNDKSIQAFEGSEGSSSRPSSPKTSVSTSSRVQSPSKPKRVKTECKEESLHLQSVENEREAINVTSKGDGNVDWLNEKVHMRVQVSNTDVSVQNAPEVLTKSTSVVDSKESENSTKQPASLLRINGVSPSGILMNESKVTVEEPKHTKRVAAGTQANLSSRTLVFSDGWESKIKNESGVSFYYSGEGFKRRFDTDKPLMLDSFTQKQSMVSMGRGEEGGPQKNLMFQPNAPCPEAIYSKNFIAAAQKTQNLFQEMYNERGMNKTLHTSPNVVKCCPSQTMLENPIFALTDSRHLACLTQGNCCCEEE